MFLHKKTPFVSLISSNVAPHNPISLSCDDHANNGPVYIQQWNGNSWERVSGWISSMGRVRPMLEKAAAEYKAKNNLSDRTIPCS